MAKLLAVWKKAAAGGYMCIGTWTAHGSPHPQAHSKASRDKDRSTVGIQYWTENGGPPHTSPPNLTTKYVVGLCPPQRRIYAFFHLTPHNASIYRTTLPSQKYNS